MSKAFDLFGHQIPQADWAATPESVKNVVLCVLQSFEDRINQLEQANSASQARVAELEERLNQNSKNSSRPPSQDAPNGKGKQSGFKPLGPGKVAQAGQKKQAPPPPPLYPIAACQAVHQQVPSICGDCGRPLTGQDEQPHRHQVMELPPIVPTVIEYQLHCLACPHCGAKTRGTLPSGVSERRYGARLAALIALLSVEYRQSHRQIAQFLQDLCGIPLSRQSIQRARQEISVAVADCVSAAHDYVRQQAVLHSDETGFKQGNRDGRNPDSKKGYLWVLVTPLVSIFVIALSRAQATAEAVIGKGFAGVLVSDRYSSYNWVDKSQRQLCWAHLLRDFQAMAERQGVSQEIGQSLLKRAYRLFHWWHRVRDGTLSRALFQQAVRHLRVGFLAELEAASQLPIGPKEKTPLAKTVRTCQNILKLEEALWTFVDYANIEPTNNAAERALRPAVIWRKLSFGSQSAQGSRFVERMLTVNASLKAQKRPVLEFLTQTCHAARTGLPGPSLLPLLEAPAPSVPSRPSLMPVQPL